MLNTKRQIALKNGYKLVEAINLPSSLFVENGGRYERSEIMKKRVYHLRGDFISVNDFEFSQRVVKALDRVERMRS